MEQLGKARLVQVTPPVAVLWMRAPLEALPPPRASRGLVGCMAAAGSLEPVDWDMLAGAPHTMVLSWGFWIDLSPSSLAFTGWGWTSPPFTREDMERACWPTDRLVKPSAACGFWALALVFVPCEPGAGGAAR